MNMHCFGIFGGRLFALLREITAALILPFGLIISAKSMLTFFLFKNYLARVLAHTPQIDRRDQIR